MQLCLAELAFTHSRVSPMSRRFRQGKAQSSRSLVLQLQKLGAHLLLSGFVCLSGGETGTRADLREGLTQRCPGSGLEGFLPTPTPGVPGPGQCPPAESHTLPPWLLLSTGGQSPARWITKSESGLIICFSMSFVEGKATTPLSFLQELTRSSARHFPACPKRRFLTQNTCPTCHDPACAASATASSALASLSVASASCFLSCRPSSKLGLRTVAQTAACGQSCAVLGTYNPLGARLGPRPAARGPGPNTMAKRRSRGSEQASKAPPCPSMPLPTTTY